MKAGPVKTGWLRYLLVAALLVAGQSLAFAHDVDEASHPVKTVCDLCIAAYPLGAAAGDGPAVVVIQGTAGTGALSVFRALVPAISFLTPGQRAPPISL